MNRGSILLELLFVSWLLVFFIVLLGSQLDAIRQYSRMSNERFRSLQQEGFLRQRLGELLATNDRERLKEFGVQCSRITELPISRCFQGDKIIEVLHP